MLIGWLGDGLTRCGGSVQRDTPQPHPRKPPRKTPLTAIISFQMAVFVTGQESEPEPRARGLAIADGPAAVTHCPWPVARILCEDNVRVSQPCAVLILWMATATWYMQGEMREPARSEMHPVSISSPVYDSGAMDGNQPGSLYSRRHALVNVSLTAAGRAPEASRLLHTT